MKIEWKYFRNNSEVVNGIDLVRKINLYGYDAYIVGGCVRDIIRWYRTKEGDPNIHDVDICTNMPITELYKKFRCESNNGEAHGTILVFNCGEPFEVTQFRTEAGYSDGRHPDAVQWANTFEEDSKRRDFTINAMAIDADGNLIDYHGGAKDLENGVLKTVGNPDERFGEDALRIIRAMRFAARFGMKLDNDVYQSICKLHGTLGKVAMERVSAELKKTAEYGVKAFKQVLEILIKTGANNTIDPDGLIDWDSAFTLISNRCNEQLYEKYNNDITMAFICLLYNCKNLQKACQHFKLETDIMRSAYYVYTGLSGYKMFGKNFRDDIKLMNNVDFNRLEEFANALGMQALSERYVSHIKYLYDIAKSDIKDLTKALQECGYKGPLFGKMLNKLTEWYYLYIHDNNDTPDYIEILEEIKSQE